MRGSKKSKSIIRVTVIALMAVLIVAGVTFAALQSRPAKITGSTIQTASAGLQISNDGSHFSDTQNGFAFSHLVPGYGTGGTMGNFYLRNTGDTSLGLKLAVTSTPTNADHVDLSKVNISVSDTTTSGEPQNFTLQSLIDTSAAGGVSLATPASLASGVTHQFHMYVSMDPDAVSSASATIGNIDLAFTGVAQP